MTKVESTEWGELNIIEKLLSDNTQHTSCHLCKNFVRSCSPSTC